MRLLIAPIALSVNLLLGVVLLAPIAFASDSMARERVKTGILLSGGFYRIYEVACSEGNSASVASLKGGRRWCSSHEGELNCVGRVQEAAEMACNASLLPSGGE